jgi:hypothetical protein
MAVVAWGGVLVFTRFVPPATPFAFLVLFLMLGIALISTFSPVAYAIGNWLFGTRRRKTTIRSAIRQGVLLTIAVLLNLFFRAADSWNLLMAVVVFVVVIVIEVLILARKR